MTYQASITVFAAMVLLWASGCQPPGEEQENPESLSTVRIEVLGKADIAEVLRYPADLKPITEVKIYSPLPDRILSFPWQDGDYVRRGQRIALIRKEGLDKGLEQLVAQAEALDVQIRNLKKELARSEELLAAGVITRQVFDQLNTQYQSTVAQRKALEAGKGQMAVNADNAVITAPISGVIANKMLQTGDMAAPQLPLCQIYNIDRLKVVLRLIEEDVAKVRPGHAVVLKLDAFPDRTFDARVTNVLPYLDATTRTNTVEVTLDNPLVNNNGARLLKPGMYGTAELVLEMHAGVVAAPEPALLLDNQILDKQKTGEILRKAFIIDQENKARMRKVRLGARNGSRFEVLEGLNAGEKIVVRGQHRLKDGEAVEIVGTNGN